MRQAAHSDKRNRDHVLALLGQGDFPIREMGSDDLNSVEEATLAFSLGESDRAAVMLKDVTRKAPDCFEAWHALTEVMFSMRNLDGALQAGEEALRLRPDDLHMHVSLSRVWAEIGDKERAEEFASKARVLGWKAELADDKEHGDTTVC